MAPQTLNVPYFDAAELFGVDHAIPQTLNLPFLDGGTGFGATLTRGTLASGVTVTNGGTVLTDAADVEWVDDLAGPGSWSFTLPNADVNMPDYDEVVIFQVDGFDRFSGVVEGKRIVTHATDEEAAELTRLSGRGRLAILDQSLVEPARGLDAEPVEITRTFAWMSVDFDDTGWPLGKLIRRSDQRTARFPNRYSPEWWPDKQSYWVWADRPDVSELEAPLGRCLIRHHFNLVDDSTITILFGQDNFGDVYLNGARIGSTENDPSSYVLGRRVTLQVSSGDQVLAANVKNLGRGGGFNFTVWTLDDEGLLDTMIAHSDDTTLVLGYPDPPPGFTATRAIRIMVEEAQVLGELAGLTLDFTDDLDSAGQPATVSAEITVDVLRSVMDAVLGLSDWLIDAYMTTAGVLRVFNWGTRGGASGVTIADTTSPATSETEGLVHDGKHTRANRLVARYRRGYTVASDPTSISTYGQRSAPIDLGDVDSEETAQTIMAGLLDLRSEPSYASTLNLLPVTSFPYDDFDLGDTITHTDELLGTTLSRLRSLRLTEDDDGVANWTLTLRDIRMEDEDRQENWLKRMAMGSLAGGARVASRSGDPLQPAVRISVTNVAEWDLDPTAEA